MIYMNKKSSFRSLILHIRISCPLLVQLVLLRHGIMWIVYFAWILNRYSLTVIRRGLPDGFTNFVFVSFEDTKYSGQDYYDRVNSVQKPYKSKWRFWANFIEQVTGH